MTAITDDQFDAIIVQLRAMVGALGNIGDAIVALGKPPPSSRPSAGKLPAARGK